jgi:hypothetical protein
MPESGNQASIFGMNEKGRRFFNITYDIERLFPLRKAAKHTALAYDATCLSAGSQALSVENTDLP